MADDETLELIGQAIDAVCKKSANDSTDNNIKIKVANVVVYDKEKFIATINLIEDENKNEYNLYNKSGEDLSEGDTVKVYYTTNVAKGWIGMRVGEPNEVVNSPYLSFPVTNTQAINYDAIDRALLSVDFDVIGDDSAVVFSAAQQCSTTSEGTLGCEYRIDGATQDFKPAQIFAKGKNILPHCFPMSLSIGKHNFAVFISSTDGGRGNVAISGISGVLSGQISGLKNIAPPNQNLLLYLSGVPAGQEIIFGQLYESSDTTKMIDWGDGTDIETSTAREQVSHVYSEAGDYIITSKSNCVNFANDYYYRSNIQDFLSAVYFPDNTIRISWGHTLENCPKLKTVYLGKSATNIGLALTGNNGGITSLIFPETSETISLTGLGSTSIASLVIPPKVTSVSSLESVTSLTSVEFQNSVLSSCKDNSNLIKVVMSDKVKVIPDKAFSYCSLLSDITFSPNITQIGANAFFQCKSLTDLPLLPYLTYIAPHAFRDCTSLQSVKLGDNLKFIGATNTSGITNEGGYVFYYCTALTDIHIPSSVQVIGYQAFYKVPAQFTKEDFPKSLAKVCQKAFYNSGVVSAVIRGGTIYGEEVFANCSNLIDVEIQEGATYIPTKMFQNCTNLTTVEFPDSLVNIGSYAFYNTGICEFGTNFSDSSLADIGTYAFTKCGSLLKVVIPNSVETVGEYAFQDCAALESVIFEKNGTPQILGYSFKNCIKLSKLDLGNVVKIGGGSFQGCISLTDVSFNTGTILGAYAFRECAGLTQISILNSLSILSDDATTSFGGKYNIGDSAFSGCVNINNVDGYTYKWNVGIKVTESTKDSDGNWIDVETDLGIIVYGIYNAMGATEDSVFRNTGLKDSNSFLSEHPEYANISSNDYKKTYSVYIDKTPI